MIAILLASLSCVNLTSCSDDDDENSIPSPSVEKRLISVVDNSIEREETSIIEYDTNGRISSVSDGVGSASHYSYYNDKIIIENNYGSQEVYYLTNGLITESRDASGFASVFKYNGGNLSSYSNEWCETTFEWQNGNVSSSKVVYDEDEYRNLRYDYDTSHVDYGKVAAFHQYSDCLFANLEEYLLIQGYFGNMPKNMLQKVTETDEEGDVDFEYYTYKYDADGYPICEETNNVVFTWEQVK